MAKAKSKNITASPKCPALALAKMVGHYQELSVQCDEVGVKMGRPADDRMKLDRGNRTAADFAEAAHFALALAPVQSLEGAVAVFLIAHECQVRVDESDGSGPFNEMLRFCAGMMIDNAMAFFSRTHGITSASLGLTSVCSEHQRPREIVREAQKVLSV